MKSPMYLILAMSATMPFAASAQAQNTNTYSIASFEVPFNGASNTKAFAINARGDIVGRFVDSGTGYPRAFLRHSDGTYAPPIDVPVANTGTVARGINSVGDIVGKYFDSVNANQTHGFILTAGGAFTSFDVTLSGAISGTTVAHSINNPGAIVGHYDANGAITGCTNGAIALGHGFLRNTNGSFTAIDYPTANVIATFAQGIDDSGNIVGSYIVPTGTPSGTCDTSLPVIAHGFLRDAKGNYTTVDVPASAGATSTIMNRISDAGDITGVYVTVQATLGELLGDTPDALRASDGAYFVLSSSGAFTTIPPPANAVGKQGPLGINPRGDLVGSYNDGTQDHGFIATK